MQSRGCQVGSARVKTRARQAAHFTHRARAKFQTHQTALSANFLHVHIGHCANMSAQPMMDGVRVLPDMPAL